MFKNQPKSRQMTQEFFASESKYISAMTTSKRTHRTAKGNKKNKLPPKTYYSLGGHNKREANRRIAEMNATMFKGQPKVRPVKHRHEKLAIAYVEEQIKRPLCKLPRDARRLVRRWEAEVMASINRRMWSNAI